MPKTMVQLRIFSYFHGCATICHVDLTTSAVTSYIFNSADPTRKHTMMERIWLVSFSEFKMELLQSGRTHASCNCKITSRRMTHLIA